MNVIFLPKKYLGNVKKMNKIFLIFISYLHNLSVLFPSFSSLPQCSWLADVCLLQCARGNRRKNTSCIIFEINKFLIGLELVQEKQLHIEATSLKLEDDTNCSVSSIEEDFLTASEHFEDEDDEYKQGKIWRSECGFITICVTQQQMIECAIKLISIFSIDRPSSGLSIPPTLLDPSTVQL